MGVDTPGSGLALAKPFYDAGHTDTRKRVVLTDVAMTFVMEGSTERVRGEIETMIALFIDRADTSEIMFTVTPR